MTWADRALLLHAGLLMLAASAVLKIATFNRVHERLARFRPAQSPRAATADAHGAERLARIVDMASRHVPFGGACLQRSLVLWWLLQRRGMPGVIRVGARRSDAGFHAHAWVELEGRPLGDSDRRAVDEYLPMPWLPADRRR